MAEEKDIEKLKTSLKGWTTEQGIKLSEKQYKSIFDLAENLGIKDIGGLTLYYTMSIMPMLESFVKKDLQRKEENILNI